MATQSSIRFSFFKITTDQFAIIEQHFKADQTAEVFTSFLYTFGPDQKIVGVQVDFQFRQQDQVFLVIQVSCFFQIHEEDWALMFDADKFTLMVPHNPALHFASLVVSLCRGVLHAKTENHPLNFIIIPPINVNDHITGDIIIAGK